MLRCKEDDLAVVLTGPYTGYMVTVGKFLGTVSGVDPYGYSGTSLDCWEIKCPQIFGYSVIACEDKHLQPIRPGKNGVTTKTEKEIAA